MAVLIETSVGDITIDLLTEKRPVCCNNFLKLCKMKYYNFSLFHSVQRNLVAQTGDPTGTGKGGESINGILYGDQAKYFDMEVAPRIKHKKLGTVSMVNNGNHMHGSQVIYGICVEEDLRMNLSGTTILLQFFITLGEHLDYLDNVHTVFGEVSEGMDVLMRINEAYCDAQHRPYKDIRCECGNCEVMATEEECICCKEVDSVAGMMDSYNEPVGCILEHPGFQPVCINQFVLDAAYLAYQQTHGNMAVSDVNQIYHTIILEDPYVDPPGLEVPDRSPEPTKQQLDSGRIGADEDIDDFKGLSEQEVASILAEKEAKANAQILTMVGDLPEEDVAPPENVLFVCKLNPVTTDEDLEIIFSRFGTIKSCEVIKDQKTQESLQYAFIEFENQEECENAYFKMDNVLIDDRRIHVDFSQSVSKVKWKGKGKGVEVMKDDKREDFASNYRIKDNSRKDSNYDLVYDEDEAETKKKKRKRHKERESSSEDAQEKSLKHRKHKNKKSTSPIKEKHLLRWKSEKHPKDRYGNRDNKNRDTEGNNKYRDREISDKYKYRDTEGNKYRDTEGNNKYRDMEKSNKYRDTERNDKYRITHRSDKFRNKERNDKFREKNYD